MQSRVFFRPKRSVGQLPMSDPSTVPQSAAPIASPCIAGLSPQSDWIVFSAPEMTTVSKPKRKPASADTTDQRISFELAAVMDSNLPQRRPKEMASVAETL